MTRTIAASIAALLTVASVAAAQPPTAPKPGPEHKLMAYFVGKWTTEGDMKAGPLGPGGKVTSVDTCEWFTGGFQVVCKGTGKSPAGPMTSLGVMSYNAADKTYAYYGIDNTGMSDLSIGNKSGNTWTFSSSMNVNGKPIKSRFTITEVSPTSYTFKWETSADGSAWSTMMEGKSTKSAGATKS